MFKKFKSGVLIIILAVLMIIYLIVRYSGSDDRTFRDKILTFDANSITQILIADPKNNEGPVDLAKSGNQWMVNIGDKEYLADTNSIKNILSNLSNLQTKRYAGKNKDAWIKYDVTDTLATLVTLKDSKKTVAEILIGKFAYNMPKDQQQQIQSRQQRADMTTYVRLLDENDVYATEGFLKMSLSSDVDVYRNRNLVNINPGDVTRITVTEPEGRNVFENQNGKWMQNGIPADSIMMAEYTTSLANLNGSKFVDHETMQSTLSHSLLIEGNNFNPVEIQAYPSADTNITYIISSSVNPGSFFNGKEGSLFDKIWGEL